MQQRVAAWPHRPQYNLTTATRTLRTIDGQTVKLFSPEWLFREKILAQHQRQGSAKEGTDTRDLVHLIPVLRPGLQELDFDGDDTLSEALCNLLAKRPALKARLSGKVKCVGVYGEESRDEKWYVHTTSFYPSKANKRLIRGYHRAQLLATRFLLRFYTCGGREYGFRRK